MAIYLAELENSNSIEVIGETQKNERLSFSDELHFVEQVRARAELLNTKRSGFTPEENRIKRLGDNALMQLLEAHQYLIRRLVLQHQPQKTQGIDPDLEQEAIAAYIDAIDRFDLSKGARLSSYAYIRIRARLQDLSRNTNRQAIAVGKSCYEEQVTEPLEPIDTHQYALLRAAIGLLPEQQQTIALLLLEGKPYEAISQVLEIGLNAVRARCCRVKKRLRFLMTFRLPLLLKLILQPDAESKPEADPVIDELVSTPVALEIVSESVLTKVHNFTRSVFQKLPITCSESQNNSPSWIKRLEKNCDTACRVASRLIEHIVNEHCSSKWAICRGVVNNQQAPPNNSIPGYSNNFLVL
jgi:RNA polymerase sigma factor (sigma-70 family)